MLLLPEYMPSQLNTIHHTDALAHLRALPDGYVNCIVTSPPIHTKLIPQQPPYYGIISLCRSMVDGNMRDKNGRFVKGQRASRKTEFKKGQHWRNKKPFWDKEWLLEEYVNKGRSTGEIAEQFGVKDSNIIYFLRKFNIPRRSISEARAIKHWGVSGENNPMYGRTGEDNPNWRGGVSPERQTLYSSREWAKVARVVWRRDKATCQRCGIHANDASAIHIHHIISFAVEEKRTDPDNLILLCIDCHWWVHSSKNIEGDFLEDGNVSTPIDS